MNPLEPQPEARLVLEDGTVYEGRSIGVPGSTFGELVFNTSVTGYPEILTDPSYRGQIVMMTQPEIGNYGVHPADMESQAIHAAGFVVRRLSTHASSWRAEGTLQAFLEAHQVVGIEGVDTRAITRRIRAAGALKAGITTEAVTTETFLLRVRNQPSLADQDLVGYVTTSQPRTLTDPKREYDPATSLERVVVVDYGIKKRILDQLQDVVKTLIVLPARANAEVISSYEPQAVVLSNGPGDPAVLHGPIETARGLVASGIPTLGICLGHQILGLACGGQAVKMPFGHHGGNHPVKDLETDAIYITSQNHSYAIDRDSLGQTPLVPTHLNLNDGSLEGFRHTSQPVWGIQFHPEAAPGPHDARGLFARFIQNVKARRAG